MESHFKENVVSKSTNMEIGMMATQIPISRDWLDFDLFNGTNGMLHIGDSVVSRIRW